MLSETHFSTNFHTKNFTQKIMSIIHVKHNHTLTPDESRIRVEAIARDLKREYKMDYSWDGNRLHFRRKGASGHAHLGDGYIELEIKLGMLLAPLKRKIEATIRKDIDSKMA